MAKNKTDDLEISISTGGKTTKTSLSRLQKGVSKLKESLLEEVSKPQEFTGAAIRDGYCDYTMVVKQGIGFGTHKIKGEGIIDDDLRKAFNKLNVHLAIVDDFFTHSGIVLENLNEAQDSPFADLYDVVSFTLKGEEENLSIVLSGTKFVSQTGGDRLQITSPKIALGTHTFYKWYNELKEIVQEVQAEVELYHNGKHTIPSKADVTDKNQLNIESPEAIVE